MNRLASVTLASCLAAGAASASPFDIVLSASPEATDAQRAALRQAARFWEGIVTGYQDDLEFGPLDVAVSVVDIDGPDGTLAEGAPTFVRDVNGFALPVEGRIDFDVADIDAGGSVSQAVFETLLHEVAHVLGFGTLWIDGGLVDGASYVGRSGVEAYRAEFGRDGVDAIPLAAGIGARSDGSHWDETWAGGPFELMTPFDDGASSLSATTIASLRDLGYATVEPERVDALPTFVAPIPLPAGAPLIVGALGVLAAVGRRRRSPAGTCARWCDA